MNSFNVYGQTEQKIGGNTPVWLGTVKPIPVGGVVGPDSIQEIIPAGTPMYEKGGKWEMALSAGQATGYLYNDVKTSDEEGIVATVAIVKHHPEGLLIDRVALGYIDEEWIATLQKNIPGVLLVRG